MVCPQKLGVDCLRFGFVLFLKNNSLPTFASRQDLIQMQDQFQTPTKPVGSRFGFDCLLFKMILRGAVFLIAMPEKKSSGGY